MVTSLPPGASTPQERCKVEPPTASNTTGTGASGSKYTGDLKVVALAAALENLAVAGYGLALSNAGKGKYGKVPPAVAEFVVTAQKQHKDHANAWNGVLKQAGLVSDRHEGRQTHYSAQVRALAPLVDWTSQMTGFWNSRFDKLEDVLKRMDQ